MEKHDTKVREEVCLWPVMSHNPNVFHPRNPIDWPCLEALKTHATAVLEGTPVAEEGK